MAQQLLYDMLSRVKVRETAENTKRVHELGMRCVAWVAWVDKY